jgi:hypothetical protein
MISSHHMPRALTPGRPTTVPTQGSHGQLVYAGIGPSILSGEIRPGELFTRGGRSAGQRDSGARSKQGAGGQGAAGVAADEGACVLPSESWNVLDPDVPPRQQEGMPQPAFLHKLTEVRLVVEPAAAELAALARSPTDYEAFAEAEIRFHPRDPTGLRQ